MLPADFQIGAAIVCDIVVTVLIVVILVAALVLVLVHVLFKKTFTGKCDSFVAGTVESLLCVQE